MQRRDWLRLGGNTAFVAALAACGGGGGNNAQAQSTRTVRRRVSTRDGVSLNVIDVGDVGKPPILFVHGLSQSALSWAAQLGAADLLARYRMVAVDLRGHGLSQGAFGSLGDDGKALPLLAGDKYVVADAAATSRLWANDIDAVIEGLSLASPVLVGWSYGAVVVMDYLSTHNGLGAASRALLTGGTPVLLPPGTAGGGGADLVFGAAVPAAVFKTLDTNLLTGAPSTYPEVVSGMAEFVALALQDAVPGRAVATRDEVVAQATFNLQLPPAARQTIVLRNFDFRSFLAALPQATRARIKVLSGSADAVIQAATTQGYFTSSGLAVSTFTNEGHAFFARNPALFNGELTAFASA